MRWKSEILHAKSKYKLFLISGVPQCILMPFFLSAFPDVVDARGAKECMKEEC